MGQRLQLAGVLVSKPDKEFTVVHRIYYQNCLLAVLVAMVLPTLAYGDVPIVDVVLSPLDAVEVPAQQTGVLREVVAREGAVVAENEVLARLDDRQARVDLAKAELERAQAEAKATNRIRVEFAEKSLAVAEAELERSQESISQFAKSISQSQLDVEQLTVEKLTLEAAQAQHELELDQLAWKLKQQEVEAASLRLQQHEVQAPFAGTVALIWARRGEWVELGAPVLRLVAIDKLRAEGFLDADKVSESLVGKEVIFRSSDEKDAIIARGTLQFVSPEMDPVTRQVRIWAEVANPEGKLRAGQQGKLEIPRE